jgi:putative ABC transport system ATP-binding protein
MSGKDAVNLEHVTRSYKRDDFEVRALDDVTLQIPEHSFVAIMGPSGSGKTTMLNLITGIDHPSSGRVAVGGEEITGMRETELADWRARHIGLVFQFYNLIPVLTAFENVELPLLLTELSKAERKTHVEAALKAVGLAERMGHYPRQLSGGQEQRVAIARAIVTDPTIVVADEPTGDLDAKSAEEILNLLAELNKRFQKTIVMVTHDSRAERFVDTTYRLDKGVFVGAENSVLGSGLHVQTLKAGWPEARNEIHRFGFEEPVAQQTADGPYGVVHCSITIHLRCADEPSDGRQSRAGR